MKNTLLKSVFEKQGFKKNQIVVIPNDIDTNRFYPTSNKLELQNKLNFNNNTINLLFVGVANYRKGFDIVFNVFKKLNLKHDITLHVVGSTRMILRKDEIMLKEIKNQINQLKLNDKIIFHGKKSDVNKYMQSSDFLIFPSRNEGFGTVQIEAMACGLVIISSFLKGITDSIIMNKKNGFYIKQKENIDDYVDVIDNLICNKKKYLEISDNAIISAHKNFSRESIMNKYLNIYQNIF